jgi:RHS repeat-associated protein
MHVSREEANDWVDHYGLDALGNTRFVYGHNGTLDVSDFYPFGGERVISSTAGNNYKFTGKERDSESGLDNFTARYFSASMGRFMSPDWSAKPQPVPYSILGRPQSLNLYSYVQNNPATNIDADGHWCLFGRLGTTCNEPPSPPPPRPNANTTVASFFRLGAVLAAAGAAGNAAQSVKDATSVTASVQVGVIQNPTLNGLTGHDFDRFEQTLERRSR